VAVELEDERKVIAEFLHALGDWSKYVVVGGGYALMVYRLYLSDIEEGSFPVGTSDIDSLIPRRIPEASKHSISEYLEKSGFSQMAKDLLEGRPGF
jgi:hypothetical protein